MTRTRYEEGQPSARQPVVAARLTRPVYDAVTAAARERGTSVAQLVREGVNAVLTGAGAGSARVAPRRSSGGTGAGRARRRTRPATDTAVEAAAGINDTVAVDPAAEEPCRHPANRRIGSVCGACGQPVRGR